jgi:predicted transcriptional regulator
MSTISVKEQMTKIIQAQPEDSSFPEILKELAFALMIDRGLQDSRAGRTISNDEMKQRIQAWQK